MLKNVNCNRSLHQLIIRRITVCFTAAHAAEHAGVDPGFASRRGHKICLCVVGCIGAQNSQETELCICQCCSIECKNNTEALLSHGKTCPGVSRTDKSYNYVCVFCEYHSYQSGHVRGHLRSHIGDKPFKCQFCDYAASRSDQVLTHLKIKH
uniref:RE1-silencing transcription factor A n=1 Tax=Cacopsylla melanoneura TaxID=428564 RepID=A0A8D8YFI3_9HEMI